MNTDRNPRPGSLDPHRLERVMALIDARLADSISLGDLAAEACLSMYHFARLFHRATGTPPHRYLIERRVQAAQEMLSVRHASLADIAFGTGFSSQANFSRVFRKITGLTPGQYRDLHSWA